jgi:hypothetical protein
MDEDTELSDEIDLKLKFNDPDQDVKTLKYTVTVSDEKNVSVALDNGNKKLSIKPVPNWNGVTTVNVTCADEEGLWVTQWFTITVTPVNDEPEFKEIAGRPVTMSIIEFVGDQAATEDQWFNFTITASDIDIERGENDEISFELDTEEVTFTHDKPLEAMISIFPTNEDVGKFEFMISIKDKSMKGYKNPIVIKIEVVDSNDAPWLVTVEDYPNGKSYLVPANRYLDLSTRVTIKENEKLTLLVTANDPDSDDQLTFHADTVSIVELDEDTGNPLTAKFIITPDEKSIGLFSFNVTVKDRKLEKDSVEIVIKINNVNDKPIVSIKSPTKLEFDPGEKISFIAEAIDKDIPYGDELTYKWSSDQDGDFGFSLSVDNSNLSIGEHMITFTAEDSFDESSSTFVSIRIGGIDKDADKLPDKWEALYFNSVSTYDGTDDPDKDGYTNEQEFALESNPTDKDDPEEQSRDEGTNWAVVGAGAAMVIIIVITLIIFFLFLRKQKAKKEEGLAGTEGPKPLIPPEEGAGAGMVGGPGQAQPPLSYAPPQMTNCPKCSTVMTFSPSTGAFCIRCGYRPEQNK